MNNSTPLSRPLLQRAPNALSAEVADGFVVMDIENGRYYSLNETGSEIWRILEDPISEAEIIDNLCRQYAIEAAVCTGRVQPFLKKLLDNKTINEMAAG